MVKVFSEIKTVDVASFTSNDFKNEVVKNVSLPFILKNSTEWECCYICNSCKTRICYDRVDNSKSFISGFKLISNRFRNQSFFNCLGEIFGLKKVIDPSGEYSYFIDENFSNDVTNLALVDFYKCPHCNSHYLCAYMIRSREPNYGIEVKETNLYKILGVQINDQHLVNEKYIRL